MGNRFPDFNLLHHGRASIWIERNFASSLSVDLLANVDRLLEQPDCVLIKDQRKITVGRIGLQVAGSEFIVYIKRYNAFSLRYRLQSFFVNSGAVNSLHGTAILSRIGIPTARAIAAIEYRRYGMLARCFFISEAIKGGKTADAYWREDAKAIGGSAGFSRRRFYIKQLAELFARLHAHGVYHNDLKDANIIVVSESIDRDPSIFLLDLEGVRRYFRLSRRRHVKNLVQLNRTLGRYLRRTEAMYFLKCYLSGNHPERGQRKRWALNVMKTTACVNSVKSHFGT